MSPILEGLKLTVIGMSVVFSLLFGLEVLIRFIAKVWGPKEPKPQAQTTSER